MNGDENMQFRIWVVIMVHSGGNLQNTSKLSFLSFDVAFNLSKILELPQQHVNRAKPSYQHGSKDLEGVPDLQSFGETKYPKYDILDLGEYSKGHLPGDEIHITKHVTIKEPQPYPVKIPVPHPYPVPVAKPYPVVETKYVKVPYAVPYEIQRPVPVPIEVAKPYPVSVHENSGWNGDLHQAGSGHNYGVQETNGDGYYGSHLNYEAQGDGDAQYHQSEEPQESNVSQESQEGRGGWTGLQSPEHQ
ncbi:unnamed protein product [Phaedon cochleariae]|uniref:Uncharacterized protein n=1 Tax=Phaedon cochleariae TaxID=80249 RepID=A0A9N9SJS3_PHACE|nr:unnamed protein product [Phaedon cochleariae]